jgi:hypothetical protein
MIRWECCYSATPGRLGGGTFFLEKSLPNRSEYERSAISSSFNINYYIKKAIKNRKQELILEINYN